MSQPAPAPRARLRQQARLRREAEYRAVSRWGGRIPGQGVSLRFRLGPAPGPRLGLVVPRGAGSAAVRNRVRRIARECFRLGRSGLPQGADLILEVRGDMRHTPRRVLRGQIVALFARLASRAGAEDRHRGPDRA